jgi:hypothetical protein
VLAELAALPIVPLADHSEPFASLGDKQKVFLPTHEQAQGRHQYAFQTELRLVCSDFLACLDPAGNSVLGVMLKKMGARVFSENELVTTHILPNLEGDAALSKPLAVLASYSAFLQKHYSRLSRLEKDALVKTLRLEGKGAVLPTSHGLCRAGDEATPVHFGDRVGQLDMSKIARAIGSGFVWRVVDMNALRRAGDPRATQHDNSGWGEFLHALGVTEFFSDSASALPDFGTAGELMARGDGMENRWALHCV